MPAFIHALSTAVPPIAYSQDLLRRRFVEHFGDRPRARLLIERIYAHSGIEQRHSVVADFTDEPAAPFYFQRDASVHSPSTAERNARCVDAARELGLDVAHKLLGPGGAFEPRDVTHVVTVSCTGFAAPGLDFTLVETLGLSPGTRRYHIGFMGCFAAFQALHLARAFCSEDPAAVVLIVCVELCTLHLQMDARPDNLVAASLFADGAAGALVSARVPAAGRRTLRIEGFASTVLPDASQAMTWTIGDRGFEMLLSKYVPKVIGTNIEAALRPLLESGGVATHDIDFWAIHPGGRAVLDKIEEALVLEARQIEASRHVLAHYGNMSSPTVLFVLKRVLERQSETVERRAVALAFGPGLTVETGLLTILPAGAA